MSQLTCISPVEFEVKGKKFKLYSEYAFSDISRVKKLSKRDKDVYYIVGIANRKGVFSVVLKNGNWESESEKIHYTSGEKSRGLMDRYWKKQLHQIEDVIILPVLCYEICFPEDLMKKEYKPDVVVHHIGSPMFDKHQLKGWRATEKALGIFYDCPVYVCSGGEGELCLNGRVW